MPLQKHQAPAVTGYSVTFFKWINQFRCEGSERGILARWVISNSDLTEIKCRKEFLRKTQKKNCSNFLINEFENQWEEFKKYKWSKKSKLDRSC